MKIKEVQAAVKLSQNYDSYQVGITAELDVGENPESVGAELIERAGRIVSEKINSGEQNITEIGGAWPSKKFEGKLSVRTSDGKWSDVAISELKKTAEGYIQNVDDGDLIYKRIPEGKRRNDRMPEFRVYREARK